MMTHIKHMITTSLMNIVAADPFIRMTSIVISSKHEIFTTSGKLCTFHLRDTVVNYKWIYIFKILDIELQT